jgi:phosphohistidine phosphatase SixA
MNQPALGIVLFAALGLAGARAQQELPPPEVALQDAGAPLDYMLQLPAGFAAERFWPVVVLLGDFAKDPAAERERALGIARTLAQRGMVVVLPQALQRMPPLPGFEDGVIVHQGLPQLPVVLRRRFHVAGGGLHLVALGAAAGAAGRLAAQVPWQFQSLSVVGPESRVEASVAAALWARPCTVFGAPLQPSEGHKRTDPLRAVIVRRPAVPAAELPAALAEHLAALQAARTPAGTAGEVALALDDFHDAADKGDLERYFARFPDDAVFLGTDATERWVGAEFRRFAQPYFRGGSGWTFVPVARNIVVDSGGRLAWFHEQLENGAYGECRGSGVLELRSGRWVVRHYDLTIPVPNDLAKGLVARIRAFAQGLGDPVATVVIVRHAEKAAGSDPDLTEAGRARAERLASMLADVPVVAVFTSEFRRTQATVAPLCGAKGLTAQAVPAANSKALVEQLRQLGPGKTALVAAHSDTIGPMLRALGVAEPVSIADDDFGELLVVALAPEGARLLRLHY